MRIRLALVVLVLALMLGLSKADGQGVNGLTVKAYQIGEIPPVRVDDVEPCAVFTVENISQDWGGGDIAGCGADRVMLHYTGLITVPVHESLLFAVVSDDGGWLDVGGQSVGMWADRGCWGNAEVVELSAGVHPLDFWMYENGGGACAFLYWDVDGTGWEIVPAEVFSPVVGTTTTSEVATTQLPSTTTPQSVSTMLDTTSTSIETTSTLFRSLPVAIETSSSTSTSVTSTNSPTTIPQSGIATTLPSLAPQTPTEAAKPVSPTTTTPVIAESLTEAQALVVASNAEEMANLTPEQATLVFEALDPNQLTDTQAEAIINAIQNAPDTIRKTFEKQINIYSGIFDNYKAVGSTVTVKQRRVMIATVTAMGASVLATRRKTQ